MPEKAVSSVSTRNIFSRRHVIQGLTALTGAIVAQTILSDQAKAQLNEPPSKPLPVPDTHESLPKAPSVLAPSLNRVSEDNNSQFDIGQEELSSNLSREIDLPSEYKANIEKSVDIFHDITSGNIDRVHINYFPGQNSNSVLGPPTTKDPHQFTIDLYFKDRSNQSLKLAEVMAEKELTRVFLTDTHDMPGNAVNLVYGQLAMGRSIEADSNNPVFNLIRPEFYMKEVELDLEAQPKLDRNEVFINAFTTAVTQQEGVKEKLEGVSSDDASIAANLMLASINGLLNNAFDITTDKAKTTLLQQLGLKNDFLSYLMNKGKGKVSVPLSSS